jgi:hypothetical protein
MRIAGAVGIDRVHPEAGHVHRDAAATPQQQAPVRAGPDQHAGRCMFRPGAELPGARLPGA